MNWFLNSVSGYYLFYINAYRNQNYMVTLYTNSKTDFSGQFRKKVLRNKRIGYNLNVMQQSACLVINPIAVDDFAVLFICMPVNRASNCMVARPKFIHFSWFGP